MSAEAVIEKTEKPAANKKAPKPPKKKKETYRLMQYLLKTGKIEARQDTFPSDQFILRNLPDAIRKTDGASRKAKFIAGLAAATVDFGLGGLIAPIALAATGVIGVASAVIGGAIAVSVGIAAGMAAHDEAKDFGNDYGEALGKRILAQHLVEKGQQLNAQRKANAEKRRAERAAAQEAAKKAGLAEEKKPVPDSTGSKLLSGALNLKKTWDESVPGETKQKAVDSVKNAGDAAKKKIGSIYGRFKNRKKNNGNDSAP
jgi:hypothetical protein